jgi:hypothetical protein
MEQDFAMVITIVLATVSIILPVISEFNILSFNKSVSVLLANKLPTKPNSK